MSKTKTIRAWEVMPGQEIRCIDGKFRTVDYEIRYRKEEIRIVFTDDTRMTVRLLDKITIKEVDGR